jgi:hypothetical protein
MKMCTVQFVLFICLLLAGCSDSTDQVISGRYAHAMDVYQGPSAEAAEAEIKSLLGYLDEAQRKHPKAVDYDDLRGVLWLRAYSLYKFKGDVARAKEAMNKCVPLLRAKLGDAQSELDAERRLAALVDAMELQMKPDWKR